MGVVFQKNVLPTLFNFTRVKKSYQSHVGLASPRNIRSSALSYLMDPRGLRVTQDAYFSLFTYSYRQMKSPFGPFIEVKLHLTV